MSTQTPDPYETYTYIPNIPFPNILDLDFSKMGIAFQFTDEYFVVWEAYPPPQPPPRPPLPAIQLQQKQDLQEQAQQQQQLPALAPALAPAPAPPSSPSSLPTPRFDYAWLHASQIGLFMMQEWESLPRIPIGPYSAGVEDRGGWWTHHSSFMQQLRALLVARAQEVDHGLRSTERRRRKDFRVWQDRWLMRKRVERTAEIFFGAMQMQERMKREAVVGGDLFDPEGMVDWGGNGNGNGEVVGSNEEEVDKRVDSFVEESSPGEDVAGSSSSSPSF